MSLYYGEKLIAGTFGNGSSGDTAHYPLTRAQYNQKLANDEIDPKTVYIITDEEGGGETTDCVKKEDFEKYVAQQYKEVHKFVLDETFTCISWSEVQLSGHTSAKPLYSTDMTDTKGQKYPDGMPYDGLLFIRFDPYYQVEHESAWAYIYSNETGDYLPIVGGDMGVGAQATYSIQPVKKGTKFKFLVSDGTQSKYIKLLIRLLYSPTYNS